MVVGLWNKHHGFDVYLGVSVVVGLWNNKTVLRIISTFEYLITVKLNVHRDHIQPLGTSINVHRDHTRPLWTSINVHRDHTRPVRDGCLGRGGGEAVTRMKATTTI